MSLFLKKFETISQYNAYTADTANFILPNVSLTVDNNTVHYNPSTPVPPTPTPDYVEIGGVKWATMNVGATGVTDTGLYFQWGDIQGYTASQVGSGSGQKAFTWQDYKFNPSGDEETMTKYNSTDGKMTLDAEDDAVTAARGSLWRIPTTAELQALGDAVNTAWTADYQGSGVAGLVCTDKTDSFKVLFFPAAGRCDDGSMINVGSLGYYWSSSLDLYDDEYADYAFDVVFDIEGVYWGFAASRYRGYSVRGVLDE